MRSLCFSFLVVVFKVTSFLALRIANCDTKMTKASMTMVISIMFHMLNLSIEFKYGHIGNMRMLTDSPTITSKKVPYRNPRVLFHAEIGSKNFFTLGLLTQHSFGSNRRRIHRIITVKMYEVPIQMNIMIDPRHSIKFIVS